MYSTSSTVQSKNELVIFFSSITEPHSRNTYYLLIDVFVWSDLCVKYIHVVIALTGAHMQPACVTELTSSEY